MAAVVPVIERAGPHRDRAWFLRVFHERRCPEKNFGGCDPNHIRGLRAGLLLVPEGPILFAEEKITMTMKTRKNIRAIVAVMTLALIAGLNTQAFAAPTTWLFARLRSSQL